VTPTNQLRADQPSEDSSDYELMVLIAAERLELYKRRNVNTII
jgi:hypothetical protein